MGSTRREFLKSIIGSYIGFLIYQASRDIIGKFVEAFWDETIQEKEYKLKLIQNIFGDLGKDFRFIPGMSHYKFPNQIHPDDKEALAYLEKLGYAVAAHFELINELIKPRDAKGDLVCLGSPMSNLVSRKIMGYQYISSNPEKGLKISKKYLPFEFRFEYIFDTSFLMKEGIITKRYVGEKEHVVPNWSLRDNETGQIYMPNTFGRNLTSDYLLITVLPNIFDIEAYNKGQKIIIFGGTHGVGTKAIHLLFKDEIVLRNIFQQIKNTPYWQALITIDDTFYDYNKKRTAPRSLSKKVVCCSVHVNEQLIEKFIKNVILF